MKRRLFLFLAAGLFFFTGFDAQAQDQDHKLMAVKFHADWCKSCKAMGPAFENLETAMDGEPVHFVKLDFTNKKTKVGAEQTIEELGLSKVVRKYAGTGFILLVAHDTKDVKEILNKSHSEAEMTGIVKKLLRE